MAGGEDLIDPAVTRDLVEHFVRGGAEPGAPAVAAARRRFDPLTEREAEVLALVGAGLTNLR